ncbi:hypothetical protein CDIK_3007 [Cucumispora dikerogammari]|nr:hypothetical protein CDIK_3007 [Cucumispora dikerogammari]
MGLIGAFLKLVGIFFIILIILNTFFIIGTGESGVKLNMNIGKRKDSSDDDDSGKGGEGDEGEGENKRMGDENKRESDIDKGKDKFLEFMNNFRQNVYITSE